MLDIMQIGCNLVYLRQNMSFTIEDISEKLNVSQSEIFGWENGNALPDIPSLVSMLDLYTTSIDELLCLSNLKTDISYQQLFASHDHKFLVHEIICNKLGQIAFYDVIHLLSQDERDYALFLFINHNIAIDSRLWPRLSVEERMRLLHAFLDKKYALPLHKWCLELSDAERKKLKEKKNECYQNVTFFRNRRSGRVSRTNCQKGNHK